MPDFVYISVAVSSAVVSIYGTVNYAKGIRPAGLYVAGVAAMIFAIALCLQTHVSFAIILTSVLLVLNLLFVSETRRTVWLRPATAALALIGAVSAAVFGMNKLTAPGWDEAVLEDEKVEQIRACGEVFGSYVSQYGINSILVVSDENDDPEFRRLIMDGLRAGVDQTTLILSEIVVMPDSADLDSVNIARSQFITVIERHPDCGLVISLVPIPMAVLGHYWRLQPSGGGKIHPRFAGINIPAKDVEEMIKANLLLAMVAGRPGLKRLSRKQQPPVNAIPLFHRNYLLIDKSNIDDIRLAYPKIFSETL